MQEEALKKLQAEMESNKNDTYTQLVGNYTMQYVKQHPAAAEKVLAEGKTLKGSLAHMRSAAEKKKSGNYAVLTPEEGFTLVTEYYGIQEKPAAAAQPGIFATSLDDYLI